MIDSTDFNNEDLDFEEEDTSGAERRRVLESTFDWVDVFSLSDEKLYEVAKSIKLEEFYWFLFDIYYKKFIFVF
jgi:hypothetical protein